MGFAYSVRNALQVPGRMEIDEMSFLAQLAKRVPHGGRIVEVGPFFGRSTTVMATANPGARITSIDTFENVDWTARYVAEYQGIPHFGRRAFNRYTRDFKNVDAIEGFSPDAAQGWSKPVDLYFEDAIHGNPGLARNIAFWTARLRPGGIACGHDYTRRFPHVKQEVDALAASWGATVTVAGSLWAVRKPKPSDSTAARAQVIEPALTACPQLRLRANNKTAQTTKSLSGFWCGAHLEVDRLNWLSIDAPDPGLGLALEYRLGHPEHGTSPWVPAGTRARLQTKGRDRPFTRLAMRLTARATGGPLHICYRVSARQIGNGGDKRSGTSAWALDGDWARLPNEGAALNAFTVLLSEHAPPHPQSAFEPRVATRWRRRSKAITRKILARL